MDSKLRIKLIGFLVIGLFLFHLPATPITAQEITSHTNYVNSVEWSPNGELLASGSTDQSVIIWDSELTLQTIKKDTIGPNGSVLDVEWLNNNFVFSGDSDRLVYGWNISEDALLPTHTFDRHNGFVKSVDIDPTSTLSNITITSGGKGSSAFTYSIEEGDFDILSNIKDHDSASVINAIEYSGDGSGIAIAGVDETIRYYLINQTHEGGPGDHSAIMSIPGVSPKIGSAQSPVLSLDVNFDGSAMVVSTREEVKTFQITPNGIFQIGSTLELDCVAAQEGGCLNSDINLSPDESKVAIAVENEIGIYSWSSTTGFTTTPELTINTVDLGFEENIKTYTVDWNPDSNRIVFGVGADIFIYDTSTGSELFHVEGEIPQANNIVFFVGIIIILGIIAIFATRRYLNRNKA